MDWIVAIPSYKRSHRLGNETLAMLHRENVPKEKITVFVANTEEHKAYSEALDPNMFREIVIGVIGLAEQRNFIYDYFPVGQKILMIDDDIKELMFLQPRPLIEMVDQMWKISEEEGATLWSIYPVSNKFFCQERVVIGKVFCVGCFHGVVNLRRYYPERISAGEDRWLTCDRFLLDGKTLRYEGCCPKSRYFAKGGLWDHRHTENNQYKETVRVVEMFPELCQLVQYKKNGMWDAKIKLQIHKKRPLFGDQN